MALVSAIPYTLTRRSYSGTFSAGISLTKARLTYQDSDAFIELEDDLSF